MRRRALATRARAAALLLSAGLALALPAPALGWNAELQPGTAATLPAGRMSAGVFAPLRWGVTDETELSLHPLLALVAPHLDATFGWGQAGPMAVASRHGILYPTPLMRLLSREGTGGIIPHDVTFPQLISTSHHLLLTWPRDGHQVTLRAGGRLAVNLTSFDGPRSWSEVEWHFVRPRTAAWYTGWSADAGLSAEGPLWRTLGYRVELDAFYMPGLRGDHAAEWSLLGTWRPSPRVRVQAGAIWSWCEFPYGSRTSVPLPLLDVAWAFEAPWR